LHHMGILLLTLMRPETAEWAPLWIASARSSATWRDGDMKGWDAQRRDGGEGRRERRARRVNHGNREELRGRRRGQERVSEGGPRWRLESDEHCRNRKDEREGGRVYVIIPAAAAADVDGRRARGGDAH